MLFEADKNKRLVEAADAFATYRTNVAAAQFHTAISSFFPASEDEALTLENRQALRQALPALMDLVNILRPSITVQGKLLCFISEPDNLAVVLTEPTGEQRLQLLCLSFAALCTKHESYGLEASVHQVLMAWCGIGLANPNQPTPEAVVDSLYGPGTYLLYFDAESTFREQAKTLKNLDLPLLTAQPSNSATTVALPDNLSL